MPRSTEPRTGIAVDAASGQMTERVAGKGVAGEENNVDQHQHGAESKVAAVVIERIHRVVPEESEYDKREVEKVPMEVVQDPGKPGFAAIRVAIARLPDRAGRWVPKERSVI